jgi:CubicO group peptidase (beta-lactamase class C family)
MLLEGGKFGDKRLLSRKSIELMSHDQLGKRDTEQDFGLGLGIDGIKTPLKEAGSPGQFGWGGFYNTQFVVDPKEQMIVIFMSQLSTNGDVYVNTREMVQALGFEAITD